MHAAGLQLDADADAIKAVFKAKGAWAVALACRACDIPEPSFTAIYRSLANAGDAAAIGAGDAQRVAANTYLSETRESATSTLSRMVQNV